MHPVLICRPVDLPCLLAVLVLVACSSNETRSGAGSSAAGQPGASPVSSAAAGSNAANGPGAGSAAGSVAGSGAGSVAPMAAPAKLVLSPGERLHNPPEETTWKIPGTIVTATVVDAAPAKPGDPPITKLVVWGNGKRHDIIKTAATCDVVAELRHVIDSRLVFRCASSPVGDSPEGMIEDWLIRWSEEKNAPLRNRHWAGDPADTEPSWASPPKPESKQKQKPAKHRKRTSALCCCEATVDDATGYSWELVSVCKSDADDEISASCVAKNKCKAER